MFVYLCKLFPAVSLFTFCFACLLHKCRRLSFTLHGLMLLLCRSSSDILHILSSHSNSDVSSSASSQWDVLQMLSAESQLVSLLGSGDFIALPLGLPPHEANQVATAAPA